MTPMTIMLFLFLTYPIYNISSAENLFVALIKLWQTPLVLSQMPLVWGAAHFKPEVKSLPFPCWMTASLPLTEA